jgi:hypothetical protein
VCCFRIEESVDLGSHVACFENPVLDLNRGEEDEDFDVKNRKKNGKK